MKAARYACLVSLAALCLVPCALAAPWQTFLGMGDADAACGVAVDTAGDVLAVGGAERAGGLDGFVVKLSPDGSRVWALYLGGDGEDWLYDVAVDAQDNVFVCGESDSYRTSRSGVLWKLAPDGAVLWRKDWNSYYDDTFVGVAVDSQGCAIVNGYSQFEWGNWGGLAIKYDPDGVKLWQYFYGGELFDDWGSGVAVDPADNVILTGTTNMGYWLGPHYANLDPFVLKLTPDGEFLWGYLGVGYYNEMGRDVAVDAEGTIYITGETMTPGGLWMDPPLNEYGGGWDAYLLKLTPDGEFAWSRFVGGADLEIGWGIDASRGVALTGTTESRDLFAHTAPGGAADTLMHTARAGTTWSRTWPRSFGIESEEGRAVARGQDGALIVAGHADGRAFVFSQPAAGMATRRSRTEMIDGHHDYQRPARAGGLPRPAQ